MSDCKDCIESIIYVSRTVYDRTTAVLKSKPLCDRGYQQREVYVCDRIKGSYHRLNRGLK